MALEGPDDRRSILYSTLSRCHKCSGTDLLDGISKVVMGEYKTFKGPEDYLTAKGVEPVINDSQECKDLMEKFIGEKPVLWNEDSGK